MQHSTVKWFDPKKGYGFIHHPEDGEDVFVHYSNIESDDDFKTLQKGQNVKFEMNDGPKGLHALQVVSMEQPEEQLQSSTDQNDTEEASSEASPQSDIHPSDVDPTAEVDPSIKT